MVSQRLCVAVSIFPQPARHNNRSLPAVWYSALDNTTTRCYRHVQCNTCQCPMPSPHCCPVILSSCFPLRLTFLTTHLTSLHPDSSYLSRHNSHDRHYRGSKMRLSFWESSFQWAEASAMPTITITTITPNLPPPCRPLRHSNSFHTMTPCHRSFLQCPIPTLCLVDSQAGVSVLSRLYHHLPTTPASCLTSCQCFLCPQMWPLLSV